MFEIVNLCVSNAEKQLIHNFSLQVRDGETIAVVGNSGAGKSLALRAAAGVAPNGLNVWGMVRLNGTEMPLRPQSPGAIPAGIVYLPQNPYATLSPMHNCWRQIAWGLRVSGVPRKQRKRRAIELLAQVGLPRRIATQAPHELSGGMRQRVAIAAALAVAPRVLIADEPTSALDAELREDITQLLVSLAQPGRAVVLVTHDIAAVAGICDRVAVVCSGTIVELAPAAKLLSEPQHPAAQTLVQAAQTIISSATLADPTPIADAHPAPPESNCAAEITAAPIVLRVSDLCKSFNGQPAIDRVNLTVKAGQCTAIIGASGSGKTTLARLLIGLAQADSGSIVLLGENISAAFPKHLRGSVQMVFQDPAGTLNPKHSVRTTLLEALKFSAHPPPLKDLLRQAHLQPQILKQRPHTLSGGERQRVALARALASAPRVLICDEFVSAVDASAQQVMFNTLRKLADTQGTAIILISHDIASVREISDELLVLENGKAVESGSTAAVLTRPRHPRTRALVQAAGRANSRLRDFSRSAAPKTQLAPATLNENGTFLIGTADANVSTCRKG